MKIGIFGGLAQWSTDHLLLRMRSLFAYSVGCFLLLLSILFPFLMGRSVHIDAENAEVRAIVFFSLAELSLWFAFIRTWREVSRRIESDARKNST
jgi:hypothetical protein